MNEKNFVFGYRSHELSPKVENGVNQEYDDEYLRYRISKAWDILFKPYGYCLTYNKIIGQELKLFLPNFFISKMPQG